MSHKLIISILIVFFGLSFSLVPVGDPDLGWHLLGGEYVDTHQSAPREDFINDFNSEWVDYHWLAQWLFYKIYILGGFNLLRMLLGVLVIGILLVLLKIVKLSVPNRPSPAAFDVLVISLVCLLLSSVISVRPQSLALILLSLALVVLLKALRFELIILTVISIVLVNVHVYWVFIPFVWLVLRVLPRFLKLPPVSSATYAWGGFLILTLTGFVSPYTYKNYLVLLDYLNLQPSVRSTVNEFRSGLLIEGPQSWIILGILMMAASSIKLEQLKYRLPQFTLFISALFLVLNGSKFLGIYVILALPLISVTLFDIIAPRVEAYGQKLWLSAVLIALCSAAWMVSRLPKWSDGGSDFIAENYPIGACQLIAKLSTNSPHPVRVLTHFNDGGWCVWAIKHSKPEGKFRVTHDGRTQFVTDQHYLDLFSALSLKDGWKGKLESFRADYLVIPARAALANLPEDILGWSLVEKQGGFGVFAKAN